jgi:hypothetical protein
MVLEVVGRAQTAGHHCPTQKKTRVEDFLLPLVFKTCVEVCSLPQNKTKFPFLMLLGRSSGTEKVCTATSTPTVRKGQISTCTECSGNILETIVTVSLWIYKVQERELQSREIES